MRVSPLPPPPAISTAAAAEHLRTLGVDRPISAVTPCAGGLSNHNYRIDFDDGSVALLRLYRWWVSDPEPPRAAKEAWLHRVLRDAGVPVPRVLASSDRCALLEWIDGVKLRDVAPSEPADGLRTAWREVGEALARAHHANPLDRQMGEIVGLDVRPFEPDWPTWLGRELERHADRLTDLGSIDRSTRAAIAEIARTRLARVLGDCDVVLLHNDAHPANVLVRDAGDEWRLAAWIDWEFAWVGDADWDLTRFEFIGTSQVGVIPEDFWTGYGRLPHATRTLAYELFFTIWLAGIRSEKRPVTAPELFARQRVSAIDQLLQKLL